jgi:putative CocE/NonD family hydrolase
VADSEEKAQGGHREAWALHLTMRDGVRLAVDVTLPGDASGPVPTLLRATRYWRNRERPPEEAAVLPDEVEVFTGAGFALVRVDVRGTGASFGTWTCPWSEDEIADLAEVVDWIVAQPWSNGRVGAFGDSYDGNLADLVAATGHPALKAVAPRFGDYDPFRHLVLPGGILLVGFLERWARGTRALDTNDLTDIAAIHGVGLEEVRAVVGEPDRVDGDEDGALLAAAVAEHAANLDVWSYATRLACHDDEAAQALGTLRLSPFARREEIEKSGVAFFAWGSWFDGGTAAGVLSRFGTVGNPQEVVIGAWAHGGKTNASPYAPPASTSVPTPHEQFAELAAFFRSHLATDAPPPAPRRRIRYWTVGEEAWHETDVWPPEGTVMRRLHLAADGALDDAPPAAEEGADVYEVDFSASTGPQTNRWQTQVAGDPVVYGDRAEADARLLTYTSAPLDRAIEVTGHPVVSLYVRSTHADGGFYAYLEEVAPDGRVTYLTEGQLRALHRAVSDEPPPYAVAGPFHSFLAADAEPLVPGEVATVAFALFPVSALVRKGHRLRLALAGHDEGTFARIPAEGEPVVTVERNRTYPSYLEVPVRPRGER